MSDSDDPKKVIVVDLLMRFLPIVVGQVGVGIGSHHHHSGHHFQPGDKFDGWLAVSALLIVGVCNLT